MSQVARMYPAVQWPVSRGTPGLASHVKWDHSTKWSVAHYGHAANSGEHVIEYDLSKADDAFIGGHNIDGRVLFPATGYLTLVGRTMAKLNNKKPEETAIVLENVQFRRTTIVPCDAPVKFLVSVRDSTGEFDVCEGGSVAVTGSVRLAGEPGAERLDLGEPDGDGADEALLTDDIYKEMRLRGYNYGGVFRGIVSSDTRCAAGELAWDGNWIPFMDTMVQFGIIGIDTRELYLPTRLQRAYIGPHAQPPPGTPVAVRMHRALDVITAGGVELRGVKYSLARRRANPQPAPKIEKYTFVPYDNVSVGAKDTSRSKRDALTVTLQVLLENAGTLQLR
ncbi:Fatty acid synthase, partial [Operophtera brumata]